MNEEREIQKKMLVKWIAQRDNLNRLIQALQLELGEEIDQANASATGYEAAFKPIIPSLAERSKVVPGEFFGQSQTEAAAQYLKKIGHAVHIDQILEALKTGGVKFEGKDPKINLYTVLVRATRKFVLVSPGTFGLIDFYPDRPRPDREKKFKRKKRGLSGRKLTAKKTDSDKVPPTIPTETTGTRKGDIIRLLEVEGPMLRRDILLKTGFPKGTVASILNDKTTFNQREDEKWDLIKKEK